MNAESVRERIRKLLALSKDAGAFSAEAALALEKAMKLMAELGISEEELRKTDGADGKLESVTLDKKSYMWRCQLAMAAADLYGAYMLYVNDRITFNGPPEVLDAAKQTYEWFLRQIDVLYRSYRKENGKGTDDAARKAFRLAAAYKVKERVRELVRSSTVKAGDGRSLVVADRTTALQKRIRDRMESERGYKFGHARSRQVRVSDGHALGAGAHAGSQVNIQHSVTPSGGVKMIGGK